MKKVFYSIGLVSVMMFAACTEDRGTNTEVVDANTDESVNPATINDYEQPGTAASTASTTYTDADYQQHAQTVSDQMANDLQLDEATATQVTRVYYDRHRQLGDLEQGSFSSTERMGGRTNETSDMNTGTTDGSTGNTGNNDMGNNDATNNMGNNTGTTDQNQSQTGTTGTTGTIDRTQIDETTDRELRSILTPEQYRQYEQNRDRYNNMQMNNNTGTMNNGTGTMNNGTGTNSGVNDNTNRGTNNGTNTGTGTDRPTGGNQ